jgi:hypothetical protein
MSSAGSARDALTTESLLALTAAPGSRVSEKAYRELYGQITGKSIVLGNEKVQTAAVKFSNRARAEVKRKRGQSMSRRESKRRGLGDASTVPSVGSMELLHTLWVAYMRDVMGRCSGAAQLQSRMADVELVGARVSVLEYAKDAALCGLHGIVSGASANCLYLATLPGTAGTAIDAGAAVCAADGGVGDCTVPVAVPVHYVVHRIVRAGAVLALSLPTKSAGRDAVDSSSHTSGNNRHAKVCILHGHDTCFTPPSPKKT